MRSCRIRRSCLSCSRWVPCCRVRCVDMHGINATLPRIPPDGP